MNGNTLVEYLLILLVLVNLIIALDGIYGKVQVYYKNYAETISNPLL